MQRMSQGLHQELSDLMISNPPGQEVYETALYHLDDRVLCIAAPQAKARATFEAVDQCTPAIFARAFEDEIVHDVLGVEDDVIVWTEEIPAYNGIPLRMAELKQIQCFTVRSGVWDAPGAPLDGVPANVELEHPVPMVGMEPALVDVVHTIAPGIDLAFTKPDVTPEEIRTIEGARSPLTESEEDALEAAIDRAFRGDADA